MIFGYNTDVKSGDVVYHVQTEDRGEKNPVIDSVIYVKGRIVDRRRTPYQPGQVTPDKLQEMVIYMVIIFAGFIYIWKKGALDWSKTGPGEV